jgi:microcystin-dependent protein
MSEIYKPAIAQINFVMASLEDTQNVDNLVINPIPPQPIDRVVTPLVVAQYDLYNRDLEDENFGLDDSLYLGYKGGFITQGDKVNNKKSDLQLRRNLFVRKNTTFYRTVSLEGNSIRNHAQKGDRFIPDVYGSTAYDHEAMTVGDFRRNWHYKGMIMMWAGTYNDLVQNLPYWRLCAPPDSNVVQENGVPIPNLEGFFVVGGAYDTNARYTPKDNTGGNFGSTATLSHGFSGGFNAIALVTSEMPTHNHSVNFSITPGNITFKGTDGLRILVSGGDISANTQTASNQCARNQGVAACDSNCPGDVRNASCPTRSCSINWGAPNTDDRKDFPAGTSIISFTTNAYVSDNMTYTDAPLVGSISGQSTVGIRTAHENRPPFYVLGYIINVGKERS